METTVTASPAEQGYSREQTFIAKTLRRLIDEWRQDLNGTPQVDKYGAELDINSANWEWSAISKFEDAILLPYVNSMVESFAAFLYFREPFVAVSAVQDLSAYFDRLLPEIQVHVWNVELQNFNISSQRADDRFPLSQECRTGCLAAYETFFRAIEESDPDPEWPGDIGLIGRSGEFYGRFDNPRHDPRNWSSNLPPLLSVKSICDDQERAHRRSSWMLDKHCGWSLLRWSDETGLSFKTLKKFRDGITTSQTPSHRRAIAKVLGVDLREVPE